MDTFVVIPCLNEQETLAATCASLGFACTAPDKTRLVLVDNGSTDGTRQIMAEIQSSTLAGRVTVVEERRQGYVPARHAGVVATSHAVASLGLDPAEVLVLQADADTIYLPGYVAQMRFAAQNASPMAILEGSAITARAFAQTYKEYDELGKQIDRGMAHLLVGNPDDVILDDKVCGFRLESYFAWGCHRRELDSSGDEMFAETTRLYMRAKRSHGASRVKVQQATALPSRRKLLEDPAAYFASAGFPRQKSWFAANWSCIRPRQESRQFLESPSASPWQSDLVRMRQRHELALFGILPLLANSTALCSNATRRFFFSLNLPERTEPPMALELALHLADERGGRMDAFLRGQSVCP